MADDSGQDGPLTVVDDDSSSSRKDSKARKAARGAGRAASQAGQQTLRDVAAQASARSDEPSPNSSPRYVNVDSYKRGGKVRKTGKARLHRGEKVIKSRKRKRMSGRY
jgi:hypothetical protein